MYTRKHTKQIKVRTIAIGGSAPVVIQSMTNTKTEDVQATLEQIERLSKAGCKIVRLTVPTESAVQSFSEIRKQTNVPLVADIHFQYKFAIGAIEAGADKVRINPGNIGSAERVKLVVDAAKAAGIPLRIGINSGSLEKDILAKYGSPVPPALVESALRAVALMESFAFENFILSIKASDVFTTIDACRMLADKCDYPQHIGITESGTVRSGTIRSSVGIGALLAGGIGDTIRVSLCGDPVQEIFVAREILKSLDLASGPVVIACPTCGRTQYNVEQLALQVEELVANISAPIKIAVMGCIVNGPGEAADADIGIAGGVREGTIFLKGKPLVKVPEEQLLGVLKEEIAKFIKE